MQVPVGWTKCSTEDFARRRSTLTERQRATTEAWELGPPAGIGQLSPPLSEILGVDRACPVVPIVPDAIDEIRSQLAASSGTWADTSCRACQAREEPDATLRPVWADIVIVVEPVPSQNVAQGEQPRIQFVSIVHDTVAASCACDEKVFSGPHLVGKDKAFVRSAFEVDCEGRGYRLSARVQPQVFSSGFHRFPSPKKSVA
jgi:hypothetical protein